MNKTLRFNCEFSVEVDQETYDFYVSENGLEVSPDGMEAFCSAIDGKRVKIFVDNKKSDRAHLDWTA